MGKDLLQSLQDHVVGAGDTPSAAREFLEEMLQEPPSGLVATEREVIIAQELFLDDSVQIMQALLHYSLAGGLARHVMRVEMSPTAPMLTVRRCYPLAHV